MKRSSSWSARLTKTRQRTGIPAENLADDIRVEDESRHSGVDRTQAHAGAARPGSNRHDEGCNGAPGCDPADEQAAEVTRLAINRGIVSMKEPSLIALSATC